MLATLSEFYTCSSSQGLLFMHNPVIYFHSIFSCRCQEAYAQKKHLRADQQLTVSVSRSCVGHSMALVCGCSPPASCSPLRCPSPSRQSSSCLVWGIHHCVRLLTDSYLLLWCTRHRGACLLTESNKTEHLALISTNHSRGVYLVLAKYSRLKWHFFPLL